MAYLGDRTEVSGAGHSRAGLKSHLRYHLLSGDCAASIPHTRIEYARISANRFKFFWQRGRP
jgi:hypothetical protein